MNGLNYLIFHLYTRNWNLKKMKSLIKIKHNDSFYTMTGRSSISSNNGFGKKASAANSMGWYFSLDAIPEPFLGYCSRTVRKCSLLLFLPSRQG